MISAITLTETRDAAKQSAELCNKLVRLARSKVKIRLSSICRELQFERGSPLVFGTPAYWMFQHHLHTQSREPVSSAIGSNLFEETIACLLGGHGIRAEIGLAAFEALKRHGLADIDRPAKEPALLAVLLAPLEIKGKLVRYRFPYQKAKSIAKAGHHFVHHARECLTSAALREWLLEIPGIGLKTASWITRNSTNANDVAIIDVHIRRAGIQAGFFLPTWEPSRNYVLMEEAFLGFAREANIPAAALDAIMWLQMRSR